MTKKLRRGLLMPEHDVNNPKPDEERMPRRRPRKPREMPRPPKGTPRRKSRTGGPCMYEGCLDPVLARHMCHYHYHRWWRGAGDKKTGADHPKRYAYPAKIRAVPDLTDDDTLGVAVAVLRRAWGLPGLTTCAGGERDGSLSWEVETPDPRDLSGYRQLAGAPTEAEAIVAAMEALPEVTP